MHSGALDFNLAQIDAAPNAQLQSVSLFGRCFGPRPPQLPTPNPNPMQSRLGLDFGFLPSYLLGSLLAMSLGARPPRSVLSSLYSALDYTDHLRLTESSLGYTTTASLTPDNLDANRYRDILAYDHALLPGPYLNAAFVPPFHPTSLSFIASQAPLPSTYTAFYTHIVEHGVRVLVNLTPLVEKGRTKAHQYWPAEDADMVLENGWKLTCKPATRIQLENGEATLERRTILIKPGEEAAEGLNAHGWGVTQFHLTSWPDHGVFPTAMMMQLMREIQLVPMPKIYPPPPTWIHCSAGVGRSGTLAAALIAQAVINVSKHSNHEDRDALPLFMRAEADSQVWDLPVRIVEHLRRYRARMVQTLEQFEALFDIVHHLSTPP
jgi:protein tyrosine phosphatase